jgi:hypothetical protein
MRKAKVGLVFVLALCLAGCVNIAGYIALGSQFALSILQIIAAFQGQGVSAADLAALQTYQTQANDIWAKITVAYNTYQADKSQGNFLALTAAIQVGYTELPALLADAHIVDPKVQVKIELIEASLLNVIKSIALAEGITLPPPPANVHARTAPQKRQSVAQLKAEWNSGPAAGIPAAQIK